MSEPIKDGRPAFPGFIYNDKNGDVPIISNNKGEVQIFQRESFKGMSLRDYFAGIAMREMAWSSAVGLERYAQKCYEIADAMLKEREK